MRNIHITAKALARSRYLLTPFPARFLINPNALLSKQPLSLHHLKTAAKTHAQVEGAGYHLYW
jgi:hypothetical protein